MCARGINGDFEYLINESSLVSKPSFQLVSTPLVFFSLFFFLFLFYFHPYLSSFFFFFFFLFFLFSVMIFRARIFGRCIFRIYFYSTRGLMKFLQGRRRILAEVERSREPFGNYPDLSSEWIIARTLLLITRVVSFLTNFAATAHFTLRLPSEFSDRNSFNLRY